MNRMTLCFCTYNRSENLTKLVGEIRQQKTDHPFRILAINNNSTDDTLATLSKLKNMPGSKLDFVTEHKQGIVHARNRAISECLDEDFMIFIDDDEIPLPGLVQSAYESLVSGSDVTGGRVIIDFEGNRPAWLTNDLLPFLAAIDYGSDGFQISTDKHPLWTANIAYRMEIFRDNPSLRFDENFNRVGNVVGGGSDGMMFKHFITMDNLKITYNPAMAVNHLVEPWRLSRSYFLKLHYRSGLRRGLYREPNYEKTLFNAPRFLYRNIVQQIFTATIDSIKTFNPSIRNWMNVSHTLGIIRGYRERYKNTLSGNKQCI